MDMLVGNRRITKIIAGGRVVWDRKIQDSSWIECPDEGRPSADFIGLTIFKYNSKSGQAIFKSEAKCSVASGSVVNALAITLPEGFYFSTDNPETVKIYTPTLSVINAPITFDGNRATVTFKNSAFDRLDFAFSEIGSRSSEGLITTFSLNIKRSDK